MDGVKIFFLQLEDDVYPPPQNRWDWEIYLAVGKNGYYYGKSKCNNLNVNSDLYPWLETKTKDIDQALTYMKQYCERRTVR